MKISRKRIDSAAYFSHMELDVSTATLAAMTLY
jgi:hypothetical protein